MEENSITAVQKVLGEPFPIEFTENAFKIRRNLLTFSLITLVISISNITIKEEVEILGLKLSGLTPDKIHLILFCVLSYHWFHFMWCAFDSFTEWRLRLTGNRVAHQTGSKLGSEEGDYPSDPRQSTLYHWWKENSARIGNLSEPLDQLQEKINVWEIKLSEIKEDKGNLNLANAMSSLQNTISSISDLKRHLEYATRTIDSTRIPASLERFDSFFKFAATSTNIRWILVELLFPSLLGVAALLSLTLKLF